MVNAKGRVGVGCLGAALSFVACGGAAPGPVAPADIATIPAADPAPQTVSRGATAPPRIAFELAVIEHTDPCAWLAATELPGDVHVTPSTSRRTTIINGVRHDEESNQCVLQATTSLRSSALRQVVSAFHPPPSFGVVLDDSFVQQVTATSARAAITDGDVLGLESRDPPPETYTDLFGEKKTRASRELVLTLTPQARTRVALVFADSQAQRVVVIDDRIVTCQSALTKVPPIELRVRCTPSTSTSVTIKNGVTTRDDKQGEDYVAVIQERLDRTSR